MRTQEPARSQVLAFMTYWLRVRLTGAAGFGPGRLVVRPQRAEPLPYGEVARSFSDPDHKNCSAADRDADRVRHLSSGCLKLRDVEAGKVLVDAEFQSNRGRSCAEW